MKKFLTSTTIVIAAAMLASPVFAQFPPQGVAPPSPEEIEEMRKQMMERMKPLVDEAFENNDEDDDGSLTKEEMVEFSVELSMAQRDAFTPPGFDVPEPTEDEMKQLKEMVKSQIDSQWDLLDTDDNDEVSKKEILTSMFGDDASDEEEDDADGTSESGEEADSSDDSDESASDAP